MEEWALLYFMTEVVGGLDGEYDIGHGQQCSATLSGEFVEFKGRKYEGNHGQGHEHDKSQSREQPTQASGPKRRKVNRPGGFGFANQMPG